MPGNILFSDIAFPQIGQGDDVEQSLKKILNYQFMLNEQLRYSLYNLGEENFNQVEWDNLTEPIYASIGDTESAITELALTSEGLGLRVSDAEKGIAELTVTAEGLTASVDGLTTEFGTLSSQVNIQAGTISSIVANVGANGTVTAASIVQKINSSGSSVMISADKIYMTGTTTFLTAADVGAEGHTTINGSLITTGTLDADLIAGGTIMGVNLISAGSVDDENRRYSGEVVDISAGAINFGYKRSYSSSSYTLYGSIYADYSDGRFYIYGDEALKLESGNGISLDASGDIIYLYSNNVRIYPGSSTGSYWEFSNTGIRWKNSAGGTISTVVTQQS